MVNKIYLLLFSIFLLLSGCNMSEGSLPSDVLERLSSSKQEKLFIKTYKELPSNQKKGAEFLLKYMPQRDLDSLSMEVFKDNLTYAYKARAQYSWCKDLPDSIFYNNVLPYISVSETRDNWRPKFYNIFSKEIKDAKNEMEALFIINNKIMEITGVEYNTNRPRVDMSPLESINCKMATCTGLSILLIDAFRSVGIPARFVGILNWTSGEGNHSWVEVFAEGKWQFTEYYPDKGGLNHSWFTERSVQSQPEVREHSIWAISYKKTDDYFPLIWDTNNAVYYASNVTYQYLDDSENLNQEGKVKVRIDGYDNKVCSTVYANTSGQRRALRVTLLQGDKVIGKGETASATDDLNDYLVFYLEPNKAYMMKYIDEGGHTKTKKLHTGTEDMKIIIQ